MEDDPILIVLNKQKSWQPFDNVLIIKDVVCDNCGEKDIYFEFDCCPHCGGKMKKE